MKKIVFTLFALLFVIIGLTGCSRYVSHYSTVGHVRSNGPGSAWMSFIKFEGSEVFKLKCSSGKPTRIRYSGELETGSLTVYYDCGEGKTELFSLRSGNKVNAYSEPFIAGTVYVIIETTEKCENGDFNFEINCNQ